MNKLWRLLLNGCFIILVSSFRVSTVYGDVDSPGSIPQIIVSDSLDFAPCVLFAPNEDEIYLRLTFALSNTDKNKPDIAEIKLVSAQGADTENVILTETGGNTGVFINSQGINLLAQKAVVGDGVLQVAVLEDTVTLLYSGDSGKQVLGGFKAKSVINRLNIITGSIHTAGKPFVLEIEALDRDGKIISGFNQPVNIDLDRVSPALAAEKISPREIILFKEGRAKAYAIYPGAGVVRIIAEDANGNMGISNEITFLPAKFKVEAEPNQVEAKAFKLMAYALNYNNEVISGYDGIAEVKLADSDIPGKGKIGFSEKMFFRQGKGDSSFVYSNWGAQKFIVCDAGHPDICGISNSVFFAPYYFEIEIDPPSENRRDFYLEEVIGGKISVFDYKGDKIPEYAGVVNFEQDEGLDQAGGCYFDYWGVLGEKDFSFSGAKEGRFNIVCYDARFPKARGRSKPVNIISAKLKVEATSVKAGEVTLKIKITDKKGRIIKDDNSTIFTFSLDEDNPDNSALLIGADKVTAKNGVVEVKIKDTQKEAVLVYFYTTPYIQSEPYEASFK